MFLMKTKRFSGFLAILALLFFCVQCFPEQPRVCANLGQGEQAPAAAIYHPVIPYSPNCRAELVDPKEAFCLDKERCQSPTEDAASALYTCINKRCVRVPLEADGKPLLPTATKPCYPPNTPEEAKRTEGICRAGQQGSLLSGTLQGACAGAILPQDRTKLQELPEEKRCARTDEDCDGQIDLSADACPCSPVGSLRTCYPPLRQQQGDQPTRGADEHTSACQEGHQRCEADPASLTASNGRWGACQGFRLPAPSPCLGIDGDCDGQIEQSTSACFCLLPSPQGGFTEQSAEQITPTQCQQIGGLYYCRDICQCTEGTPPRPCTLARIDQDALCNQIFQICERKTIKEGDTTEENTIFLWSACRYQANAPNPQNNTQVKLLPAGTNALLLPRAEICNNKDDDCDGLTDNITGTQEPYAEGCTEVEMNAERAIRKYCGLRTCQNAQLGSCEKHGEICNGKDDDCDGLIDNIESCNFIDPQGRSLRGYLFCLQKPDGSYENSACRSVEICNNNVDDDNDGQIDEANCIPPLQIPSP
jgi:hypothetical protein